jgi:hypothetical protein
LNSKIFITTFSSGERESFPSSASTIFLLVSVSVPQHPMALNTGKACVTADNVLIVKLEKLLWRNVHDFLLGYALFKIVL